MRLAALSVLALAACTRAPAPIDRQAAPREVARAEAAIATLKDRLLARLTAAMTAAGPAGAVGVCSSEARSIAEEVGREHGVELGRTSFKLRAARNAPRSWAAGAVSAAAGSRAREAKPAVFDLSDRVGVLVPIPVGAMCLTCHGPRASLAPEVTAALAAHYPDDRATGFEEGDLRGFFWAEVKKQ